MKLANLPSDLKALAKCAILSRPTTLRYEPRDRQLVVMGNGPSLKEVLDSPLLTDGRSELMAVNFAAISDAFFRLRPQWYILMDPLFFSGRNLPNLNRLREAFACVDWPMTLIVPRKAAVMEEVRSNPNISVATINAVGIDGSAALNRLLFGRKMAMPRPRNVLIPAIMAGIWAGYRKIVIVGADHSWMRSLWVDDRNHVVSVQPHFYAEGSEEQKRVDSEYEGYRLHDIVKSFYVAFEAYHRIADFARSRGIEIVNATPSSMIDAFPRATL